MTTSAKKYLGATLDSVQKNESLLHWTATLKLLALAVYANASHRTANTYAQNGFAILSCPPAALTVSGKILTDILKIGKYVLFLHP